MENVLTLIGAPGFVLEDQIVAQIRARLRELGADVGMPVWLAPSRVCDLSFGHLAPEQADSCARAVLADAPVDVVAQAALGRKKAMLVADMDSTMVTAETLDELAEFAGIKDKIAHITARAMNGEIGFEDALKERIGLLRGLSMDALEKTWEDIEFVGGAKTLVQTMKANGAYAILVSGGFKFFTAKVREICGFDEDRANEFIFEDGKLMGVVEPILGREAKLASLIEKAALHKLPLSAAVAVGDGANDLDMIQAAGLGVAFHAKPLVAAQARVRVDHNDLTALLFAQGYAESDFVN